MAAPELVVQLVDRFNLHRDSYTSSHYNETQLRREFIDPFFSALGWDVHNERGYAESYKDVIHEDAIKIGGTTKAPDYCFRIGGLRKFFVETKRPSVRVKDDNSPAFQLRRYAWTAKLPLSVVTNFKEFAVYDCLGQKPNQRDKASQARILYLESSEYVEQWKKIEDLFAREAILRGAFDRFVESRRARGGTAVVDDEFLNEIESWRNLLARNVAARNPDIAQRELNFAVQRTIDRIIFLRICEDRGIERSAQLQAYLNGPKTYARLRELFQKADERYNSGLFHFHKERGRKEPPDELTLTLHIDDAPLKDIIGSLYYPESPYEFSVLPADILGQVYEQFLGRIIRLTKGHQARIEEKPEIKKAGGVFYTPTYVVRYIVEITLGALLEGKNAQQASKLRVLDPACGSGSFLIDAYQKLLDWHRDHYLDLGAGRFTKQLYQTSRGEWRLTTAERKRILLNNIYGVDIDAQAVEVTKLSLLLKVLEGENHETLEQQLRFFKERALPDLANNIKCGNTLVGPDFFNGKHLALCDEEELLRLNAFDWDREFEPIIKDGGFDAIIGNPPYVRMEMFKDIKEYLRKHYVTHAERTDLYVYFVEREHELLREGGRFGMIVSNKFIRAQYGEPLRAYLESIATIHRIVDLAGLPVFRGATVRTIVLLTEKRTKRSRRVKVLYSPPPPRESVPHLEAGTRTLAEVADPLAYNIPARELKPSGWRLIRLEFAELMDRLGENSVTLKNLTEGKICRGVVSGLTSAFVISPAQRRSLIAKNRQAAEIIHPFVQGRQIRRYEIAPVEEHLIYTPHGIDMGPYPAILEHLRPYRKELEARATRQEWYELQQPQQAYVPYLEKPKIIFPDIATGCRFALDTEGRYGANTVYFLPTEDLALLGVLNSRLAFFFFQQTCAALEGPGDAYLRFFGQYVEGFPVRLPKPNSPGWGQFVDLVRRVQTLNEQRSKARTAYEQENVKRTIASVEKQIDDLVFGFYGLKSEDVRLIDQVAPRPIDKPNDDSADLNTEDELDSR